MPTNWDDIASSAATATDAHYNSQISSLTSLNDAEIEKLIMDTGISKLDLTNVLKEVKDATKSNNDKVSSIKNITNGVDALVGLAAKFI
jgi:hypothetical protein